MLKNRALLGLMLVAMIATAAGVWLLGGPIDPPPSPSRGEPTDAAGHVDPATGNANGLQAASSAGGNASSANNANSSDVTSPIRFQLGPSAGTDRRPCRLEVTVLAEHQGSRAPVPFTDVAAVLTDLDLASAIGRTDTRGITEYTFAGGDGYAVRCIAGIGGQRDVTLKAESTIRVTIVVTPKVIATGRVIDQSSVGIADADIVLLRWPNDKHSVGSIWRIGRSGRDGSFHIPVAVGGQIAATHEHYVSSAMFMLRPNRNPSQPPTTQTFELLLRPEAATMIGVVYDQDGLPISNAEIEARQVSAASAGAELVGPPRRTHSDANGAFRITGLPTGEVRWSAVASDYGWHTGKAALHGNGDNRVDIELPLPAAVKGTVVSKATGKAIAGATVSAGTPRTMCYRSTKSRPDGSYLLDLLGSGTAGSGQTVIRAEFEQQVATTSLTLVPDYVETWRAELLFDDSKKLLEGIVLDANKRPLADWQVIVRQRDHDPTGMTTNEHGRFAIPVVQTRGLDVRCYAPGRPPTAFADARQRNAQVGQSVVLRTGQFERTTIVGSVLGSSATGVAATIGCWHHENHEYARHTADGDGRFTIGDVPIGTVNLTIEHADHVAHETDNLKLAPAVPVDLGTIQLSLGGGLYGTVIGPAGIAPTLCELTLSVPAPGQPITAEYVGGSYRFAQVPPGKHTMRIQGEEFAAASFQVTIEAGVDLPRSIELQNGWRRRVRVHVPPGGGERVTLAMRIKGEDTRWISSGLVQRDVPGAAGFALFDTCMLAGKYEIAAVTPQGYEVRSQLTYDSDAATPLVMQVAPR
ncbi:MAG: hypothetical protein ACJA0V_002758 [Planctomycetota bacterium]